MARLPEFLNISAAGRVRLALPTARLAIIAFSFTLAAVGMGAFVATLPSASAVDAAIDGAAASPDAAGDDAQRPDPTLQDDAASGDPSASGGSYSAPGGTLVAPVSSGLGAAAPSGTSSSSGAAWWAMDLGSTNGSWLTPAGEGRVRLESGVRRQVRPADELTLGAGTSFVLVEGLPG